MTRRRLLVRACSRANAIEEMVLPLPVGAVSVYRPVPYDGSLPQARHRSSNSQRLISIGRLSGAARYPSAVFSMMAARRSIRDRSSASRSTDTVSDASRRASNAGTRPLARFCGPRYFFKDSRM